MKPLSVALAALIACWSLSATTVSYASPAVFSADYNSHQVIIRLLPELALTSDAQALGLNAGPLRSALRAAGADTAKTLNDTTYLVHFQAATSPAQTATRLAHTAGIVYAEPNYERELLRTTNDPLAPQQWHLDRIQAPLAWDTTIGEGITVALLDTGVSLTHPDLQGRIRGGYDLFNNDADPSDDEGHGTHVAGVVAANGDNGEGGVGICWRCTVLPIKVLGPRGRGSDATIATGIRLAVDQGARIIGMSLGGPEESRVLRDAVDYATSRNVLIVAASGNDGSSGTTPNYPAAFPSVLAVSATDSRDQVTTFSTTGDFVDIAAPGTNIRSTFWSPQSGDTYASASGTSESTPMVVGVAALVLTQRPDLTAPQLAEIIEASADDIDAPGRDSRSGYGRLNAAKAVELARAPDVLSRSRIEGQVTGIAPDQVTVTLNSGQQTRPDANGFYRFAALPTGTYTVAASSTDGQQTSQQVFVSGTQISIASINLGFGGPAGAAFNPVAPTSEPGVAYYSETGHTLRGEFRTYWQRNGGLPVFGFPLSEEVRERGDDGREYVVQYFERNRFELHPENAAPYNVQLGRLGDTILRKSGRDWSSFPKGGEQADCRFFAETGHSLCGAFLRAWSANGLELDGKRGKTVAESLALFGMPLSEPQLETFPDGRSYVVQWFERARFEDHGPDGVLFGLLGRELLGK